MRWVILTDDHPPRPGGVSVITARIARELAARDHTVSVCARYRSDATPIPGTRLYRAWGPSFGQWGGHWLAARAIAPLMNAERVLATTWPAATALGALELPYTLLGHGSDLTCPPYDPSVFQQTWKRSSARFVLSHFLADTLAEHGFQADVIPAPVAHVSRPKALSSRDPWVLVARATPLKGGERFISMLARARQPGVIVGDGPERPRWEALAQRLGAEVRFAGAKNEHETLKIVSGASLCVLLPRTSPDGCGEEGFGLALIEAAALGIPVVGCRTGGVPEALGPGLLLADPEDADASVEAIERWWHPERGEEAWTWCRERHGTTRCVDAIERAWD